MLRMPGVPCSRPMMYGRPAVPRSLPLPAGVRRQTFSKKSAVFSTSATRNSTLCSFISVSLGRRHRRLRALDLHAVARAHVRPVVPDGAMLGAAVVPEGDRVLAPVEAH